MKKNFPWFKPDVNRKLIAKEIKKFTIKNNLTMGNAVDSLEKKLGKIVLSSNQTLIWDTLNQIDLKRYQNKITLKFLYFVPQNI